MTFSRQELSLSDIFSESLKGINPPALRIGGHASPSLHVAEPLGINVIFVFAYNTILFETSILGTSEQSHFLSVAAFGLHSYLSPSPMLGRSLSAYIGSLHPCSTEKGA